MFYPSLHTLRFLTTQPRDYDAVIKRWYGLKSQIYSAITIGMQFKIPLRYTDLTVPQTKYCVNFNFSYF